MPETSSRNYQSTNMHDENERVSWKKFYVFEAGKTHGAHFKLVKKLKSVGQTEVRYPEDSDYVLVICPAVSRVGTNISEALESMPADKPAILVVMHHTFNVKQVVADSRRQVEDKKVRLTVDCLFYEEHLLDCERNDQAMSEITMFLPSPTLQVSGSDLWNRIRDWWGSINAWTVAGIVACVVFVGLVTALIITVLQKV